MTKTDEIVWAIIDHAIAHLDFEDCVVYLLDSEREVLEQKAAYGPKNPHDRIIINVIDIPLGQGIVGSAAKSGQPICLIDTRKDPRYIVDDVGRLSELAVPIIFEGRVLGVIDSEHSEIGFFTSRHQKLLMTLSALAAPRIAFYETTNKLLNQTKEEGAKKILELSETISELKDANKLLQDLVRVSHGISREKNDLIIEVGYNIRTPLTSIIGYSEHVIEKLSESGDEPALIEEISSIKMAGEELANCLDQLIQLSEDSPALNSTPIEDQ